MAGTRTSRDVDGPRACRPEELAAGGREISVGGISTVVTLPQLRGRGFAAGRRRPTGITP